MLALPLRRDSRIRDRCAAAFALVLLAIVASAARAQQTQSPDPATPPASDESLSNKSGLMNELGKLLKSPADLLPSLPKLAPDSPPVAPPQPSVENKLTEPQPAPPAPSAAAPASQFFPGFVGGREACPLSSNGSPDCQAGADRLCQSKGYKSGKSMNTDAAFTCSTKRAPGRKPCGNESFVTRAFCQ